MIEFAKSLLFWCGCRHQKYCSTQHYMMKIRMSAMKLQCCTWPILMARWLLLWMKGWPSTCLHPFFFYIWAFRKKSCVIECLISSLKFHLEPYRDLTWKWWKAWFLVLFFFIKFILRFMFTSIFPKGRQSFRELNFLIFF